MSAIFISHSSKDNAVAGEVKAKLLEQGHRSVFLDFDPEDGIPAGRNWEKELYARLRGCQAVIVLCSGHSMASPWCFAEITQARSLGKHLFPLKVADCQISPLLSDVQVTDLTLNLSEGYQRLWSGLKKVGLDPADLFDWDGARPPYPGLLAFQEQDAAVYFGRDAAIQGTMETLNRLQHLGGSRLVLVLGASGSGKSSLVRAGVIPRLKRDRDRWLVLEPFRPLGRPFDQLAMVLAGAFASLGNARDWKPIRDALNPAAGTAGSAHLFDLANDLRVTAGRREATVLLVVDQFEELLGRDTDPSASLFFRLLKAVLSQPSSPFLAVATLRSDLLGAFQIHEAAQDLLYEPIHLPQMALADFAQVIEGPAKVAGIELEAGLAQAMVADTATDDALPLLAFTLRELWDRYSGDGRLTLEEYRDRLGGLQGSLARAAEALFAERPLSPDEELHLRKAFLSMVRVDEEGRYVRKPARWKELPEDVHDLLERFVQARLLVSRSEGADRILEVAHEALFRSWDRLVAWLNADREFLLWRQRLRGDIAEWERNEHDESMLLRGPVLAEARRWLHQTGDRLDLEECRFIDESVIAATRRRRQRLILFSTTTVFLALMAITGLVLWQSAEKEKARAEDAAWQAKRGACNLQLLRVQDTWREYPQKAAQFLEDSDLCPVQLREFTWGYLHGLAKRDLFTIQLPYEASDHDAKTVLSSDGKTIAGADRGRIQLWKALSGEHIATLDSGHAESLAVSADGQRVAYAGNDNVIKLWDVVKAREILRLEGHTERIDVLTFSADGTLLASVGYPGTLKLWNTETGEEQAGFVTRDPGLHITSVAFSPDGKTLAFGGFENNYFNATIQLFDTATLRKSRTFKVEHFPVGSVVFSLDGNLLAGIVTSKYQARDERLKVWDIKTGALKQPEFDRKYYVANFVAFSSDGRLLASASGRTIVVWDAESGRELQTIEQDGQIIALSFSLDSNTLISANKSRVYGENVTINLWDAESTREWVSLKGHGAPITGLSFSSDGRTLASASGDRVIKLWDVVSGKERTTMSLPGGSHPLKAMSYSRDGTLLALGGGSLYTNPGELKVWKLEKGLQPEGLAGHTEPVFAVAFSPDGQLLASGGGIQANELVNSKSELKLWETKTGQLRHSLEGHFAYVYSVAFKPDGKTLASSGYDGTIRLWDTQSGQLKMTLKEHKGSVGSVAFSPNGKTLASSSNDRTVKLWDPETGEGRKTLKGHSKGVCCVAFSSDGKTLASSDGLDIRLWDPQTGQERATLDGIVSPVRQITFSPDSKTLASGHADGTIRLWKTHPRTDAQREAPNPGPVPAM